MKKFAFCKRAIPFALAAIALPATAAVEIYNEDDTTVSIDASFNTFYSNTSTDNGISGGERDQSRIRMGFLPNWVGFTFGKQVGDIKLGGRASFWVSINDSDETPTDGLIDTRQFYGTVDASWGQILFGKDFTLYNRSNIFLDEILLGYGWVNDTIGLVDGGNVSFGNIGSGYIYPLPTSQITYRSPEINGFKLAVGLVDPSRTSTGAGAEETMPRIEGELTYNTSWDGGSLTAWGGFLQQTSESSVNEVDSTGVSYGAKLKFGGLSLGASGYDGEGVGFLIGPADCLGLGLCDLISANGDEVDSSGYLLQAAYTMGDERFVLSYGESEVNSTVDWVNQTATAGFFHNFHANLIGVLEYNMNEIEIGGATEEADTISIGLIVNF